VALARALAVEPKVLLLDEPFGALDAKVRQELRRWLRRLHEELHVTSVFVTHDQEEALELADRIVVMNEGKIEQQGSPEEVFEHPATSFVMNFLEASTSSTVGRRQGAARPLALDYPEHAGTAPHCAMRVPELDLTRADEGGISGPGSPPSTPRSIVGELTTRGRLIQVELGRDAHAALAPVPGERLYVKPRRLRVFLTGS
jgi:sulfate transport system ATP-binding protein